jgi:plasmid replication initiation protein
MNSNETELSKRDIIKQSHSLNNASYKLGSLSTDIIFAMISELKQEDKDFKLYKIKLRDLEKKINKRIDSRYLKKTVKDVMSNPIGVKSNDGSFTYISWVSIFTFNATKNEISFRFDSELKPLLMEIQNRFVKSHLKELSSLQSEYSKRIYNLLKQWEQKSYFKISVSELQDILQVPKSLLIYSNFKLKVLNKAINQINKNTTLSINLNEEKNGRKVETLIFNIRTERKENHKPTINENNKKEGVKALNKWLNS